MAGVAGLGAARLGGAWRGTARQVRHGKAGPGTEWRGMARFGAVGQGRQ